MKRFNTTAVCIPSKHYMVDLTERVKAIKKLVDDGRYFTINRARQYGKTTTIEALRRELKNDETICISLDFQDLEDGSFADGGSFSRAFSRIVLDKCEFEGLTIPDDIKDRFRNLIARSSSDVEMDDLFRAFRYWFREETRPIVLIIDEVDSATNNQVFLDFLAQLRSLYLKREVSNEVRTFQSVILTGVTDIRHIREVIRPDGQHKENSPWNIATDFNIDMSLSEQGIRGMLDEYEEDHKAGMDTVALAGLIRAYTNGYPFLVSRICQLIDEEVSQNMSLCEAWSLKGFDEAIKLILAEDNTLFQSMTKNLNNFPELKSSIRSILMEGTKLSWNPDQSDIVRMQMYGFIRNVNNSVRIDNRIFETRLYNLFLSDGELKGNRFFREGDYDKNLFVENGKLNIRLILEHFVAAFQQIYGSLEEKFNEKDGRELFLLYLKPIINGTGNYYIEAQTRDQKRTDVIVDYLGQQYIIELKIWHGERYNAEGEKQICEYLDYFGLTTGYMLSFNFNKNKKTGLLPVYIGDKLLYEATV
ncbi:MAG: ATP-binding protein [Lachnospiraceae bacterium]|nr:ATP-binding protein [Lachnospiraceae bacterium]